MLQMIQTLNLRNLLITLALLCVGCSTNTPAPIKDQTSSVSKAKPAAFPSGAVSNEPKPAPAAASKPKAAPSQTSANNTPKTPVREPVVADPGFRIGKPSTAPILESFNSNKNKGIDYGGKMGDPVLSAADGNVIFSGNSLRSYGNLVIVKHNPSYISIYAHNNKNLVKEGDIVKRGQKIAEMGNTESDRVKLHFELRRDSKPIDPAGYFDN
jgi:lipoprotein NlpD